MKARNRHRLKYFIMWANHTWGVFPACRERFRGAAGSKSASFGQALAYDKPQLEIKHSLDDLEAVAEYCARHYWPEPNHLQIGGKPVFAFWRWEELESQLVSLEVVNEGLERMRKVARRAGWNDLHIMVNVANYEKPQTTHCWWPGLIERVKTAGGDSVFGYNVSRTPAFPTLTDDWPVVPYDEVLQSHEQLFRMCEGHGIPFHPVATVGFDNSPRWHQGATLPVDFRRLQYEPIVVGNTPEKFGRAVELGLQSIRRQSTPAMLLLNAWNEWTEGCYLLPEQYNGTRYLEALQQALSKIWA